MAWPAVKRGFTQERFLDYLPTVVWGSWRPNKIVWHNTALPTLAQWKVSADADQKAGRVPGTTRIANLERYFRVDNRWPGCPHLFIADDLIWVMNPLTLPGTHSPSWNSSSIGIEMIGDFSKEDDDSGPGLAVKNNTIFATALLCEQFGLEAIAGEVNPQNRIATGTIFLHKQDPRTTHNCPGQDIAVDKFAMIGAVTALMAGGDHPTTPPLKREGFTTTDDLQVRGGPGIANRSIGALAKGTEVVILNQANNGSTGWFLIEGPNGLRGWSAARYIQENA